MFIVTPIVGVCNCSMFCCTWLYAHSSIAIILMGKRELDALLNLSSWCLVMVEWLFLAVPWGCLRFVIVVFPDHTHLLFKKPWLLFLKTISKVNLKQKRKTTHFVKILDNAIYKNYFFSLWNLKKQIDRNHGPGFKYLLLFTKFTKKNRNPCQLQISLPAS